MKRLMTLIATLLGALLLASAAPAAKGPVAKDPTPEEPAAYRHYVACGLSQKAKPAHVCRKRRDKGAFFRSNQADVVYTVCVKFPTKRQLCASKQEAKKGTLYVNEITSNIAGRHRVTWFVKGQKVGAFEFVVLDQGG
ncbi:MAG TPA: hypothetical protein VIE64_08605 [Solirubrobacterales bacterium]|jgi:hypothetical protein